MSKTRVFGIYDDEEVLLHAVKFVRNRGYNVKEVYSPFPIHGLDDAMDIKPTRLSIASFLYGITGLGLGLLMMWYMMIFDWPINIGGKPNFSLMDNLTSFIPPAFELIVFCAAHGIVITFLAVSGYLPGVKRKNPFPETTDDKFAMEIEVTDVRSKEKLHALLKESKAFEIKEIF